MSQESMKDHFHFRFKNYNLNPKDNSDHRKFFAKRKILNQDITEHIKKFELDLKSESAPKRIYWGDAGVGKSHTILHIVSFLQQTPSSFSIHRQ